MENEIWKDVKGYEGYYQVSNMGRVKSMRVLKTPKNGAICRKNSFLSTKATHDNRYIIVALCRDGEIKPTPVHRLVAEAFIPNPNNLPFVNHKDENPQNNHVDNLEWCTHEYNLRYSLELHGMKKPRKHQAQESKPRKRPKSELVPLCAYTLSGEFVGRFDSVWEAIEKLGIESNSPRGARSNIRMCCKGKSRNAFGYRWRYADSKEFPQYIDSRSKATTISDSTFLRSLMKFLRENGATIRSTTGIRIFVNGETAYFGRGISADEISKMIDSK